MKHRTAVVAGLLAFTIAGAVALAQPEADGDSSLVRLEGGGLVDENTVRTARETVSHSITLPSWTNPRGFEKDVFTFARIIFWSDPSRPTERGGFGGSYGGGGRGGFGRMGWIVDYPDADLNLSYWLQQLTSAKVDPDARVFKLTSPDLAHHPFIFMEHIERRALRPAEVAALRQYLLGGGTLLVTDFRGAMAGKNFQTEGQKVLPGRRWTELSMNHPIFRCV